MSLQVTHPSRLYLTLSLTVVIFQLCLLFLSYFFCPCFFICSPVGLFFNVFVWRLHLLYISAPLFVPLNPTCLLLWSCASSWSHLCLHAVFILPQCVPSRVFPRVILCVFLSLHLWPISPSLSPLLFLWTCSLLFIRLLQWLTTAYWL